MFVVLRASRFQKLHKSFAPTFGKFRKLNFCKILACHNLILSPYYFAVWYSSGTLRFDLEIFGTLRPGARRGRAFRPGRGDRCASALALLKRRLRAVGDARLYLRTINVFTAFFSLTMQFYWRRTVLCRRRRAISKQTCTDNWQQL